MFFKLKIQKKKVKSDNYFCSYENTCLNMNTIHVEMA